MFYVLLAMGKSLHKKKEEKMSPCITGQSGVLGEQQSITGTKGRAVMRGAKNH